MSLKCKKNTEFGILTTTTSRWWSLKGRSSAVRLYGILLVIKDVCAVARRCEIGKDT